MAQVTLTTTPTQDAALARLAAENKTSLIDLITQRAMQGVSAAVTYVLDRDRQRAKEEYAEFVATASPDQLAALNAVVRSGKSPK